MSVFTQGNNMSVFVTKDTAYTAPSTNADLSTMLEGQVTAVGRAVGGSKEQVIGPGSSAGTYDYFRLAYKVNGNVVYGPKVDLKNQISFSAGTTAYAAPQEQIWSVGFVSNLGGTVTNGSLDVSQANEFIFTIAYDHDDILWSEQKLRNSYDYYSVAPTQQNLAQSMTSQINYKEYLGRVNGTGRMVRAEMFCAGSAATTSTSVNFAVTNGSDVVTASGTGSADLIVGAIMRFGYGASSVDPDTGASLNSGSASGRAAGVPVYTIVESNMNATASASGLPAYSFRIHTPFQGVTATALSGTANAGIVATPGNFGFTITGLPLTWQKDFFKFNKVKFHFDIKGFGASLITKTQESSKGKGYFQEVAEYESFAAGNEGILNRMVVPLPLGRSLTDTSTPLTYTTTAIASTDYSFTSNSSAITGNSPMRIQQFVFFPASGNGPANKTLLANQLNGLLGVSL